MVTVAQIIEQAKTLDAAARRELVKQLVDTLGEDATSSRQRSLTELRGLGKEIWADIDAQDYVDGLRDEWDKSS
jgi:hypothetical protein